MRMAFAETCNYAECVNKDNCERYAKTGAYDMKFICSEKDYKWMVCKETELVVKGDKNIEQS
jgi:hypothetical protein